MNKEDEQKSFQEFSLTAKIFHWGFILIFCYGVFKQIDNINQLEDLALLKFEIIFALLFMLFLIIRFIYMKRTQKSSLPPNTTKFQKAAVKLVHCGLYVTMFLIAISGLMIGLLYWVGLKNGLLIETIIFLHESSVSIVYWLIGLHLIGAVYHWFKNDGVWESMVPILNRNRK